MSLIPLMRLHRFPYDYLFISSVDIIIGSMLYLLLSQRLHALKGFSDDTVCRTVDER